MKVIIVIKNVMQTQKKLADSGYDHLLSAPKNIICDYDLKTIAMVLQNANAITETIAVAIGGAEVEPALEYCLALGVSKAVRLDSHQPACSSLEQAKMLQSYAKGFSDYLVVFGYNSALNEINAAAPMLATLLDCSSLHMALDLSLSSVKYRKGLSIVEEALNLPAVITTHSSGSKAAAATMYDVMRVDASQITTIDMPINTDVVKEKYYKKEPPEKKCKVLNDMMSLHGALKTAAIL